VATETDLATLLALPAGRDLDAAVAEHVMGWTRRDYDDTGAIYGPWWVGPEGAHGPFSLPPFSTDIAAAWAVVEYHGALCDTDEDRFQDFARAVDVAAPLRQSAAEMAYTVCLAALWALERAQERAAAARRMAGK
jgi:hypothetical protein